MAPELLIPAPAIMDAHDPVDITPESAGWEFAGLRVVTLAPGEQRDMVNAGIELAVLPLEGSCSIEVAGRRIELAGRDSVFTEVSDFAYVGTGAEWRLSSSGGGTFALPSARAERRIDAYHGAAAEVPVEIRGAGGCSRQLNNFLAPDVFDAERLTAVEVLTPPGNWSSYPPHKHDDASNGVEAKLEEIYYFRIDGADGFGMHRTYDLREGWDVSVAVHDGDAFLVPSGYHGPCIAAPDFAMYYLNVLAGAAPERSLAFTDDPRYHFVRDTWKTMSIDERLPMATPPDRSEK